MLHTLRTVLLTSLLLSSVASANPEVTVPSQRVISVSAEAVVHTAPDQVIVRIGVESSGLDLAKILADTDSRTTRIKAVATAFRILPEHIQTESITLQQRYVESKPAGYTAQRSVTLCTKDLARVNELLTKLVESGANRVDSITFETSALRKHRDAARVQAVRAAREKAELFARELGVKVGRPITISEGGAGLRPGSSRGYQNFSQDSDTPGASSDGGFAAGQIAVTASVSVVFALE